MNAVLHSDGGARGNPGPAAIGVVLEFPGTARAPVEIAETIGDTTNNVAEYRAILRGLELAKEHGASAVDCYLDSELVAKQLSGDYRVRKPHLATLAKAVHALTQAFTRVQFMVVTRRENRRADRLVNAALDAAQKKETPRTSALVHKTR